MAERRQISVITCVRNQCEEFFSQCAASVGALSTGIEWIVVDDGSSDEAALSYRRIVDTVASHVAVRLLTLPYSGGLSRARNAALEIASGEWVVVLDSDDRLAPCLDCRLLKLPSDAELVAVEATYFTESTWERRRIRYFERLFKRYGATMLDPFLWFDFYYHGIIARTRLLRRIGGYRDELEVGEDQDILFRAVEATRMDQVHFIHELGYEYRNNPDGICAKRWDAVRTNYTVTMLAAAKRRGAEFVDCRFGGAQEMDGARIDQYEYRLLSGEWLSWESNQGIWPNCEEHPDDL